MDNLHMELMDALKKEHEKAVDSDKYCKWWQEECQKTAQLEQQKKQNDENLIALAKCVDEKNNEILDKFNKIVTLKARVTELEEQNNPHFSADMDMCVDVPDGTCDIPMEG